MVFEKFKVLTDTATLCIYDLECLKHRLNDDADWWAETSAELEEVNNGNVAFLGVPADGEYVVSLAGEVSDFQVEIELKVPSGKVFVGAAEEVSSFGLEPEGIRGGAFVELDPGNYLLHVKGEDAELMLSFSRGGTGKNNLTAPARIS